MLDVFSSCCLYAVSFFAMLCVFVYLFFFVCVLLFWCLDVCLVCLLCSPVAWFASRADQSWRLVPFVIVLLLCCSLFLFDLLCFCS